MLASLALATLSLFAVNTAADGPREGSRARLLEPQPLADEFFTESLTLVADLADGTYVQVQLGISNAGPGDGNGACRALIVEKGEPAWTAAKVVDRPEWAWDGAKVPTFTLGPCRLVAGASVTLVASIEGATLELGLEADAAKLRADAMRAKSGDDFYDLEILVPWAKAKAKVARPGRPVRELAGFGYLDHSRATALPKKTAKRWVRFFGLGEGASRLILLREPPSGAEREGWTWAEGSAKGKVAITRHQLMPTGKKREASWKIMLDGEGGPWRITSKELLYRDAPLEEHGWLGAVIGAIVGNPVTYTYRAVLEGKVEPRPITGLLDVAISDE